MLPQAPEPARHPAVIRHPSVVRAAVSPSAAVVTAAGVAIGLLAHSIVLAVVLGGVFWFGRMLVAVIAALRQQERARLRQPDIDPFGVPEPWRQFVSQALSAQSRFDQAVRSWPAGPLHDRLALLQPTLAEEVGEVWSVARQGAALTGWTLGVRTPDRPSAADLSERLRQIQASRGAQGPPGGRGAGDRQAGRERTEEALAAQLQAARRAEDAAAAAQDRLRLLTARLDNAVTSLLELGMSRAGDHDGDDLSGSVDALGEEIAALRAGLREAAAALPPGPALAPPGAPPTLPPPPATTES